jgi:nitrate reductase NapE component
VTFSFDTALQALGRPGLVRLMATALLAFSLAAPALADEVAAAGAVPVPSAEAAPASASVSEWGARVFDAVFLRPMGALAVVGGFGAFVATSPLVGVSQAVDFQTSWDAMVVAPWEYTAQRPLGEL